MNYPYNTKTSETATYTTTQPYIEPTVHHQTIIGDSVDDQWIDPKSYNIHPAISLLLNFFFPGIGHVVFGQVNKGVSLFLVNMIMSCAISFLIIFIIGICLIPVLFVFWIMIMIDGWKLNSRLYHGTPIMKGECTDKFVAMCSKLLPGDHVFVNKHPDQLPSEYISRTSISNAHSMP
jgi:TM2 domain-containing membrane protein YozV